MPGRAARVGQILIIHPMKNPLLSACLARSLTCSAAAALAFSFVSDVRAAERFWADAAGQTTWSVAASWSNGLPANSAVNDTATFLSVTNAQPVVTANRSINGIDFRMANGGLNFTSDVGVTMRLGSTGIDATGQLSGTNTISVETFELNANPTWTLFSNTDSATTSTFTVDSNVNINGQNWIITPNRNSAAGNAGVVNFNGVLSGSLGATGLQLYAGSFRNTINLSGANTYTGRTSIRSADVVVNSLANAGTASALGASGDIVMGNNGSSATLTFNNLAADGATDRLVLFQGTGTANYSLVNNSATGRVSFNNAANIGSAATPTTNALNLRFAGSNTELNTFGQIIHDRANSGITNVRKEQAGTWVLAGNNSYTGTTTLVAGSLFINGNQSLATGAVDVGTAATLGGIGTIGGAVTLNGAGRLAPGAGGIGQLTLNNGLALNSTSGGGLSFEIGGSGGVKGVDFDSLIVSAGPVSFGSDASLFVSAVNSFNLFQVGTYDLYDFASGPTGNFAIVSVVGTNLVNNSGIWTGSVGGYDFTFTTGTGVLSAEVSAIPEPASVALLAGLSVLGGASLRRRRRC